MLSTQLPPEIILLVCELLAADKQHHGSLFNLALASKTNAPIALEQLYGYVLFPVLALIASIYETSPALSGTYGKHSWTLLWRSILASTKGVTAYPYAAYMRTLSLGMSLDDIMSEMLNETANRKMFCAPPLDDLVTCLEGRPPVQRKLRAKGSILPRIDTRATAMTCGETIISYIERLAGEEGVKVSLAHLELNGAPSETLAGWCARIGSGLVSLRLRDGSVLTADVGRSVSRECPAFNDLTVFYCHTGQGDGTFGPDERYQDTTGLAAFLDELRPDTLVRFENMSQNDLGERDLKALARHARSLRSLRLRSLALHCLTKLRALTGCTNLEYFQLENHVRDHTNLMDDEDPQLVKDLSAWFGKCKALREFNLKHHLDSLHLVKDLMFFSNAPLEILHLQHFVLLSDGGNKAIFEKLVRHDKTLRELTVGGFWEFDDMWERPEMSFNHPEVQPLINSICSLQQLRVLNLQGSWLEPDALTRIILCSPHLEDIRFSCGECLDDSTLDLLGSLENLKVVMILTETSFTYERLIQFGEDLDVKKQTGIQIDFMQQTDEFGEEQEAKLVDLFATRLNGNLRLGYFKPRGEYEDSDSDSE